MRIRTFRAWMGTFGDSVLPVMAGLVIILAMACKGKDLQGPNFPSRNITTPTISSFAASPATLTLGQTCTLSWIVTDGTDAYGVPVPSTLSIDQGIGSVTGASKTTLHPQKTTTYTLTATNVNGTTTGEITVTVVPSSGGTLSVFAGIPGNGGNIDGPQGGACFSFPSDLVLDGAGNLYITDSANNTIRVLSASGIVSTLAGVPGQSGFADGSGNSVTFNNPSGLAIDGNGNLYVADTGNNIIRKMTPAGVTKTIAGKAAAVAGSSNGVGQAARFNSPFGVAVDGSGNVYVADSYNNTIRKLAPVTNDSGGVDYVASTFAGTAGQVGSADGTGASARFREPTGLATDAAGNIYVADFGNNTIRKITPDGVVTTFAGTAGIAGFADDTGSAASFNQPYKLATDGSGNLFVADMGNNIIRMITPDGVVSTLAGLAGQYGDVDETGPAARFYVPIAVATDGTGNVFVADSGNKSVRRIDSGAVVTTLAGHGISSGSADDTGYLARFENPGGLAVGVDGNIYVADTGNSTIRKITPAGAVTTLAGNPGVPGHADGTGSAATFGEPYGIAVDQDGNVYVTDMAYHDIRKITPDGVVSTLAGKAGTSGTADGTGTSARFNTPTGVVVDASGTLFVADYWNDAIRKITPAGVVTTFAGKTGAYGCHNATGTAALFYHPRGLSLDSAGNIYVADMDNQLIRKITAAGVVTTLAGVPGTAGHLDDLNETATFYWPYATAVDADGNVYVADYGNNTIRKVTIEYSTDTDGDTLTGHTNTVAGYPGKNLNATGTLPASLDGPAGLAFDPDGNLFIAVPDAILKIGF